MNIVKVEKMRFACHDEIELWRANTLMSKEPGTVAWIKREFREHDVFFDIGANIGLYSILAAQTIRAPGMVYAFEPHIVNAASLLRNIQENRCHDRVRIVTAPLHSTSEVLAFNYISTEAGSSGSQLGHNVAESGAGFNPVASDYKCSMTLDQFVKTAIPTLIKIDVDGNELLILEGAVNVFTGDQRPRSVQIEMHPRDDGKIVEYMTNHGYRIAERHHTAGGNKKIAKGADPSTIPHNAIFSRV